MKFLTLTFFVFMHLTINAQFFNYKVKPYEYTPEHDINAIKELFEFYQKKLDKYGIIVIDNKIIDKEKNTYLVADVEKEIIEIISHLEYNTKIEKMDFINVASNLERNGLPYSDIIVKALYVFDKYYEQAKSDDPYERLSAGIKLIDTGKGLLRNAICYRAVYEYCKKEGYNANDMRKIADNIK